MRISCVARNAWWNEIVKIEMNEQKYSKDVCFLWFCLMFSLFQRRKIAKNYTTSSSLKRYLIYI